MNWWYLNTYNTPNLIYSEEVYFSRYYMSLDKSIGGGWELDHNIFTYGDYPTKQIDSQTYEINFKMNINSVETSSFKIPYLFVNGIKYNSNTQYYFYKVVKVEKIFTKDENQTLDLQWFKLTLVEDVLYRLVWQQGYGRFNQSIRLRRTSNINLADDWSKWESDVKAIPNYSNNVPNNRRLSFDISIDTSSILNTDNLPYFFQITNSNNKIIINTCLYHLLRAKKGVNRGSLYLVPVLETKYLSGEYWFGEIIHNGTTHPLYAIPVSKMGVWSDTNYEYLGSWTLPYTTELTYEYDGQYRIGTKIISLDKENGGNIRVIELDRTIRVNVRLEPSIYINNNISNLQNIFKQQYFNNVSWLNNTPIKHLLSKSKPWLYFNQDFYICSKEYGCDIVKTKIPSISDSFVQQELSIRNSYNTGLWTNERQYKERIGTISHSNWNITGLLNNVVGFGAQAHSQYKENWLNYKNTKDQLIAQRQDLINSSQAIFETYDVSSVNFYNHMVENDMIMNFSSLTFTFPRFVGDISWKSGFFIYNDYNQIESNYSNYYQYPRKSIQATLLELRDNFWWKIEGDDWYVLFKNISYLGLSSNDIEYVRKKLEKGVFVYNPSRQPLSLLHDDQTYKEMLKNVKEDNTNTN